MAVIVSGNALEIPGLRSLSFVEDESLRLVIPGDGRRRTRNPDLVVWHTTQGYPDRKHPAPQYVREIPAEERDCTGRATILYWRRSPRVAGAHLVLDTDGTVLCTCDLETETAYHTPGQNGRSIGVEVVQAEDAALFRAQLDAVPILAEWLSATLRIDRRVRFPYRKVSVVGDAFRGHCGHRDCDDNRGWGDPGDYVMMALPQGWERS